MHVQSSSIPMSNRFLLIWSLAWRHSFFVLMSLRLTYTFRASTICFLKIRKKFLNPTRYFRLLVWRVRPCKRERPLIQKFAFLQFTISDLKAELDIVFLKKATLVLNKAFSEYLYLLYLSDTNHYLINKYWNATSLLKESCSSRDKLI